MYVLLIVLVLVEAEVPSLYKDDLGLKNNIHVASKYYSSINKVSLTQRGYIQFLRYIVDVPTMTEFTSCIWLRSVNLTYAHPILSYSRHEEDRYIRVWISPRGKEINMAILENKIFKIPAVFRENRWYHICVSWDSNFGYWSVHLNAKLRFSGYERKLLHLNIPSNGDVVVGQEYTDFAKGLEDGIEGDIYGFNMVLESTAERQNYALNFIPRNGERKALGADNYILTKRATNTNFIFHSNSQQPIEIPGIFDLQIEHESNEEVPSVLSYFSPGVNRLPKAILSTEGLFQDIADWFQPSRKVVVITDRHRKLIPPQYESAWKIGEKTSRRAISTQKIIVNEHRKNNYKPLGVQLIELSYNCALGKGAPISHPKVLVSWTKSPIRVFGGAVLRNILPFCIK